MTLTMDEKAATGRATSYWQHVSCPCGWRKSVQINAKPASIRKGFRQVGEHFAGHRAAADRMQEALSG